MDLEPWNLVNKLYPDLVLIVEGKKLYYHQAVLAQHSSLLKTLLLKSGCCKCHGEDCRRSSENIFISLGEVKISTVQYVMDIIYSGSGAIAGDTEEYRAVIDMIKIHTLVVEDLDSSEGFVLEEVAGEAVAAAAAPKIEAKESPAELRKQEVKKKQEEYKRKKREKDEEKRKEERNKRKREASVETLKPTGPILDSPKASLEVLGPGIGARGSERPREVKAGGLEEPIEVKDEEVEILAGPRQEERFSCPFQDCSSESRTAQSIKVHLALVHYKKTIQAEYPNWRTQKCEQCDRGFGQMTAYYLHMAQHKKYPHMESSGAPARVARPPGPPGPGAPPGPTASPSPDTRSGAGLQDSPGPSFRRLSVSSGPRPVSGGVEGGSRRGAAVSVTARKTTPQHRK